jgi:hypothetical protein
MVPSSISVEPIQRTDWPSFSSSYIKIPGAPEPWIWFPPPRASVPDSRLRRLARHLHSLGERGVYELLREIIAGRDAVERLERYAELNADIVHAVGADRLPPLRRLK